ncbi:phosphopyruvate hydratase [Paenibacillus cymbidii]|uniref:phosphopyruvate hydratase n=1 Tax=Paenibacillus cymbidii TaxID=1639034 RepID=UPI0010813709|nr:phosphopyruvate hydratase [Paenibacillus cymbidii]
MATSTIRTIRAREVLDSRGNPTVEVDVQLSGGHSARMMVPSGASTGKHEAVELRDGGTRFRGLGVRQAVASVNGTLAEALRGFPAEEQERLDRLLLELDGTANKSGLGANALLGVSMAVARAAAVAAGVPFYRYVAERYLTAEEQARLRVPVPMVNIVSGGLHAGGNIDLQDFLVMPAATIDYPVMLEMISAIYWHVKEQLRRKGYTTLLADEGGFGPALSANEEALEIIAEAMAASSIRPGADMGIALDVASTHFYEEGTGLYRLRSDRRETDSGGMIDLLAAWVEAYPIVSIEDGLAEDDWSGWTALHARLGDRVQLVGDDLFTTNPARIREGIERQAANAVLVKMNQIGTLTETVEAVRLAKAAGFATVVSARSGETEDSVLADLAVGLAGDQIKIGSLARSSRCSKYNQLLRIHDHLQGGFCHFGA